MREIKFYKQVSYGIKRTTQKNHLGMGEEINK